MSAVDMQACMATYRQQVTSLGDPAVSLEAKLKILQELNDGIEKTSYTSSYATFVEVAVPKLVQILKDGQIVFIDGNEQQFRKNVYNLLHRLPVMECIRPHYKNILTVLCNLLENENEENGLVALRIIGELIKVFRPYVQLEAAKFLQFAKNALTEFIAYMRTHFELVTVLPNGMLPDDTIPTKIPGLTSLYERSPLEAISMAVIEDITSNRVKEKLLLKTTLSGKVIVELPVIIALFYQTHKQPVAAALAEMTSAITLILTLQPSINCRLDPNFNREAYMDLLGVQLKLISFLIYTHRVAPEQVSQNIVSMACGFLALMRYIPPEATGLRRELLGTLRHLLGTDIKQKMSTFYDHLFDEELLTTCLRLTSDPIKTMVLNLIADVCSFQKASLSIPRLRLILSVFSRCIFDQGSSVAINRFLFKMLVTYAETARQKSEDYEQARSVMLYGIEVFLYKLRQIAKCIMPFLFQKCGEESGGSSSTESSSSMDIELGKMLLNPKESLLEIRESIKTLFLGIKNTTWALGMLKASPNESVATNSKVFNPSEIVLFEKLVKYGLKCLDICLIQPRSGGGFMLINKMNSTWLRGSKEDKELCEVFSNIFTSLNLTVFKEVMSATCPMIIEWMLNNSALQNVLYFLFSHNQMAPTFINIALRYLQSNLEDMGAPSEKSLMYLRIFKVVFTSVPYYQENSAIVKEIVNKCLLLVQTAPEPYMYFLLLRALFRSVSPGDKDTIYSEFMSLLPNLLQELSSYQSGIHYGFLKEMIVELCLIVPVKLSILLPHLHELMDPLIYALNGSQGLVSQCIRTLELCVDHLQADVLFDLNVFKPELVQALWKTCRHEVDSIAVSAFRLMGKLGGLCRRMMREPPKLSYQDSDGTGPCIKVHIKAARSLNSKIDLPVGLAVLKAYQLLKLQVQPPVPITQNSRGKSSWLVSGSPSSTSYYQRHAWVLIKSYLVSLMPIEDQFLVDHEAALETCLQKQDGATKSAVLFHFSPEQKAKACFRSCIVGLLYACGLGELKDDAIPFTVNFLQAFTTSSIIRHSCVAPDSEDLRFNAYFTSAAVDGLLEVICDENLDYFKLLHMAVVVIFDTGFALVGSWKALLKYPLFSQLTERMIRCCYELGWMAKNAGCRAIGLLVELLPVSWLKEKVYHVLSALLAVVSQLSGDVSYSTTLAAKTTLDIVLRKLFKTADGKCASETITDTEWLSKVTLLLLKEAMNYSPAVRKMSYTCLQTISELTGISLYNLLVPHKAIIDEHIPPKKNANQKILSLICMELATFCANTIPKLFAVENSRDHIQFCHDLNQLCECDDDAAKKLPQFRNVGNMSTLRTAALATLRIYGQHPFFRDKCVATVIKNLLSNDPSVLAVAKEIFLQFTRLQPADSIREAVIVYVRPVLSKLGDYKSLTCQNMMQLSSFLELYPDVFNDKLCVQLLSLLMKGYEHVTSLPAVSHPVVMKYPEDVKLWVSILDCFDKVNNLSPIHLEPIMKQVIKMEQHIFAEVNSPFLDPLVRIMKRFDRAFVDFLLSHFTDPLVPSLVVRLLKRPDTEELKDNLEPSLATFLSNTRTALVPLQTSDPVLAGTILKYLLQIIWIFTKRNHLWLLSNPAVMEYIHRLWLKETVSKDIKENLHNPNMKIVTLIMRITLAYIRPSVLSEIDRLFQILYAYNIKFIADIDLLSTFIRDAVIMGMPLREKRGVFIHYQKVFHDSGVTYELKSVIIQYLLIPLYVHSMDAGDVDQLITGCSMDSPNQREDIIQLYLTKIIDTEKPFQTPDALRTQLLLLATLFIQSSSNHFQDPVTKRPTQMLSSLIRYAWPCLMPRQDMDPTTKYTGFYLLAWASKKFNTSLKLTVQVFHGLLKAQNVEARAIARRALDIIVPTLPSKKDGYAFLGHWTKSVLQEDGHNVQNLSYVIQVIVAHYRVYYCVRHSLADCLRKALTRLSALNNQNSVELKKLALDLVEVFIKWENMRTKEDTEPAAVDVSQVDSPSSPMTPRRVDDSSEPPVKRARLSSQSRQSSVGSVSSDASIRAPFEKHLVEPLLMFLAKIACQISEANSVTPAFAEQLVRRSVALFKIAFTTELWAGVEIKFAWMERLFSQSQDANPNVSSLSASLDIILHVVQTMPKESVFGILSDLPRNILNCLRCVYAPVVEACATLLQKLLLSAPPDEATQENYAHLLNGLNSYVNDTLSTVDRNSNLAQSCPVVVFQILKNGLENCVASLEKTFILHVPLMLRLLQKALTGPSQETTEDTAQTLTSLSCTLMELLAANVALVNTDQRKNLLSIMSLSLEQAKEPAIIFAVINILKDWTTNIGMGNRIVVHIPLMREKLNMLMQTAHGIMQNTKFSNNPELLTAFFDAALPLFTNPDVKKESLSKLSGILIYGTVCCLPEIRQKCTELIENNLDPTVFAKLMFILSTETLEPIIEQYWIKAFFPVLIRLFDTRVHKPRPSKDYVLLPSGMAAVRKYLLQTPTAPSIRIKAEMDGGFSNQANPLVFYNHMYSKDNFDSLDGIRQVIEHSCKSTFACGRSGMVDVLRNVRLFLEEISEVSYDGFVLALGEMCFLDTDLAHQSWVSLFPQLWASMNEQQWAALNAQLMVFLGDPSHQSSVSYPVSPVGTILDGLVHCEPPVVLNVMLLKVLGETCNVWHRCTLMIEKMAMCSFPMERSLHTSAARLPYHVDLLVEGTTHIPDEEILHALVGIYKSLHEHDLHYGVWYHHSAFPATVKALGFEQQGMFEHAQQVFEGAMATFRDTNSGPVNQPFLINLESNLWFDHWCNCCRQLAQWDLLADIGRSLEYSGHQLLLEASWKQPQWGIFKDTLSKYEPCWSSDQVYLKHIYKAYQCLGTPEELRPGAVENHTNMAFKHLVSLWRQSPGIVQLLHLPYMESAQRVLELVESSQVQKAILPCIGPSLSTKEPRPIAFSDVKPVWRNWRSRSPIIQDDLSHWSDIILWRHYQYQCVINAMENTNVQSVEGQPNISMQAIHSSLCSLLLYGDLARKLDLVGTSLTILNNINNINSVPVVDCFTKLKQQLKCHLRLGSSKDLQDGLEVIEATNVKFFNKDMVSELYVLKSRFLYCLDRIEDANRVLSEACQLNDGNLKAWATWGELMEILYCRERKPEFGEDAVHSFANSCRQQTEIGKSQKSVAHLVWLLSCDNESRTIATTFEQVWNCIPVACFGPFLPQLISLFVQNNGDFLFEALAAYGKVFPQLLYLPVRTFYVATKQEHLSKFKQRQVSKEVPAGAPRGAQEGDCVLPVSGLGCSLARPAIDDVSSLGRGCSPDFVSPYDTVIKREDVSGSEAGSDSGMTTPSELGSGKPGSTEDAEQLLNSSRTEPTTSASSTGGFKLPPSLIRCTRIIVSIRDHHPGVVTSLEAFIDQVANTRGSLPEEILQILQTCLNNCLQLAFNNRSKVHILKVNEVIESGIAKILSVLDSIPSATVTTPAGRAPVKLSSDPLLSKMKLHFPVDFNFSAPGSGCLHSVVTKLQKWIHMLEARCLSSQVQMEERYKFLLYFNSDYQEIDILGEFPIKKGQMTVCPVKVNKFLPKIDIVQHSTSMSKRIHMRGSDGKIYSYLVISGKSPREYQQEARVFQIQLLVNTLLLWNKETSRRFLQIVVPRHCILSSSIHLIEDHSSSVSLLDIYRKHCTVRGKPHDQACLAFYDSIAKQLKHGEQYSDLLLQSAYKSVQNFCFPDNILENWARTTYPSAEEFFLFRSMFTKHLAVVGLMEFCFHLNAPGPDQIFIHRENGKTALYGYHFEYEQNGCLLTNRAVPFRLGPNVSRFITPQGLAGPYTHSVIAASRVLVRPKNNLKTVLKVILKDELSHVGALKVKLEQGVTRNSDDPTVTKAIQAVDVIITRLEMVAVYDEAQSRVPTLVTAAASTDNLCRTDPMWYPWL